MKKVGLILVLFFLISCSSMQFVESWKNPKVTTFTPNKLLVIGMTDNATGRAVFENEMKSALEDRDIKAEVSNVVLSTEFTSTKQTEASVNEMIGEICKKQFDAVLITSVKGVHEQRNYRHSYYTIGYQWTNFEGYYFEFQDVFHTPDYYSTYKVYHVETAIYNITKDEQKSLVWVGLIDMVDPKDVSRTATKYVSKIIKRLENEQLLKKNNKRY